MKMFASFPALLCVLALIILATLLSSVPVHIAIGLSLSIALFLCRRRIPRSFALAALACLAVLSFIGNGHAAEALTTATVADPSLFAWFAANEKPILRVSLGLTELMALMPFFSGNGILDTIIKALKALSANQMDAS